MRPQELIRALDLTPHPEGGHFRETFRSPLSAAGRACSTAIWFLLQAPEVSRWHRVDADEAWHWYEGDPLELLVCERPGTGLQRWRLGPVDPEVDQLPQRIVPAGWWQAARPLGAYALTGCTVAPAFAFAGFTLVDPAGEDAAWFRAYADPRLVDA